jgi:F-type H+-transporting ATPase subunit b
MHINWWTLAFQTVNVLILIWILSRFFFRPVAEIVAKRQEATNKLLADAAVARQEATKLRTDTDNARAELGAEREKLIEQARKAAQVEKASLLAQSSEEIAKLRSEAEAAIAREKAAAEQSILARASELSVEIARRLLTRLPSTSSLTIFVDGLCQQVRGLPAEAKESFLATAATDGPCEVITAAPLSKDEMAQVRQRLTEAFGKDISVDFRSDPALLAGIELHSPKTIVRNTWQADLERIRAELNSDGHNRKS